MTQFTCKGVKQNNNRISLNMTFTFTIRISAFFVSAGIPNGEFPEILTTKCRSRFYCTWFFSRAEDFESWRKGPSKSREKCSRRKVHMYGYKRRRDKIIIRTNFIQFKKRCNYSSNRFFFGWLRLCDICVLYDLLSKVLLTVALIFVVDKGR